MTIAGSLNNALSGLTATARATEVVSSNVANANTPGYATRQLEVSSQYLGGTPGGVKVNGVTRLVDQGVINDRVLSDASAGHDSSIAAFLNDLESIIGTPEDAHSLSGRLAQFEAALVEASSRPDNESRLNAVLDAAQDLVSHINGATDGIQQARMEADTSIANQVTSLNEGLKRVETLNYEIQETIARGLDPSSLMDLRQQEIDKLSPIVPLRQAPRDNGMVALYTDGGAILLDGKAATVGFSQAGSLIVPEMTQASGALSGLTLNGLAMPSPDGQGRNAFGGGTLAAAFEIRDVLAVDAQKDLDAFSRDLVERFQDPALDTTRAVGAAGLFTDAGSAFDPTDEVALSERLAVNTAVDPAQGGAIWRLRDGLGAATPGEVGNAQLLQDLTNALTDTRTAASADFTNAARSSSGLAADFLSSVGADRLHAENLLASSSAQNETLKMMELESGVDTDNEMQKLLLIEQAYAANARVIATVDEMIQQLLSM
ncbi:flagellar hook-associated protein FlgK [Aliiroseovarius sp.]|uniref:flagellar hook-associated protein FlgK n=1 Tax=Aliiroseovarius sp. TaxID=1872442 RepID=UPI003BAD2CAF